MLNSALAGDHELTLSSTEVTFYRINILHNLQYMLQVDHIYAEFSKVNINRDNDFYASIRGKTRLE